MDGLRFPEDRAFFVEQFGPKFIHLRIIASDGLRADRYLAMEHDDVPFEIEDRQPVESRIDELRTLATAVLANESLIATLGLNVLNCLREFTQAHDRECQSR